MTPQPVDELVPPVAHDPVPDLVEKILGVSDYVSPAYWLGWVAEQATGTNPWQWIADQYAGDWQAVQKAGKALENLGEFNTGYGVALRTGMSTLSGTWDGKAAGSASTYFTTLGDAVESQAPDLKAMGQELITMATGMYETANAISGLFATLLDLLIAAAAEAAATAATSWTGVGLVAGGAALALTLAKATSVWRAVLDAHSAAWIACQGLVGVMAGYLGGLHDLDVHALPSAAYDHPGV
ncbi:hypothetical protein [Rhodococcus sp. X156]|uniref:hypothetical protein n=1 Tax=Rhodococcus sp. X156 TaxID=2499145 RepID=UPI0019D12B40|nr:hypothetical protein [Rhodococcus sp. X156]